MIGRSLCLHHHGPVSLMTFHFIPGDNLKLCLIPNYPFCEINGPCCHIRSPDKSWFVANSLLFIIYPQPVQRFKGPTKTNHPSFVLATNQPTNGLVYHGRIWWTDRRERCGMECPRTLRQLFGECMWMFLCPNQRICGCTVQFSRGQYWCGGQSGVVVVGLVFSLSVSWCMLILIFVWTVLGQPHTTRSGRIIDCPPGSLAESLLPSDSSRQPRTSAQGIVWRVLHLNIN